VNAVTSDPNKPDTTGSAVPPYEGRRAAADVDGEGKAYRDGANVGGATGPVENANRSAPDPADTPRGATGSPADEQPASDTPDTDLDDEDGTGPAHHPGTPRAEDQS
jgi:hypothetical protein